MVGGSISFSKIGRKVAIGAENTSFSLEKLLKFYEIFDNKII